MSMEEWPDNRLDDLFRKSAEEYDAPFDPADWADMNRRLDEHDRQSWFDRISRWGGIGALLSLLLGGVGWVVHDPTVSGNHQQTVAMLATSASKGVIHPAETSRKPVTVRYVAAKKQSTLMSNVPVASKAVPAKLTEPQVRYSTAAGTLPGQIALRENGSRPVRPDRRLVNDRKEAGIGTLAAENRPTGTLAIVDGQSVKPSRWPAGNVTNPEYRPVDENAKSEPVAGYIVAPEAPTATETGQWLSAISAINSLTHLVQANHPIPTPALIEVLSIAPARRAIPRLTGLSVMLFAAPDLSTIGLKNFDRPGSNLGAAIQYQLTDRLSVNAGAMYSVKRYQSAGNEYILPWSWEVKPTEIQGICTMIDVPVNVRYDWLVRPRGDGRAPARWFASVGATSYFIQHEVYVYEYADPTDPKIKGRGWDNKKAGKPGGAFGFSNLNVSVGYERPITNRLSWQMEPFMKIPLQQIGNFKVRLLSTGAFVGLRYRL